MIQRVRHWWWRRGHPTTKLRAELAHDIRLKTFELARCRADAVRNSLVSMHYEHEAQVVEVQIERLRHELTAIDNARTP